MKNDVTLEMLERAVAELGATKPLIESPPPASARMGAALSHLEKNRPDENPVEIQKLQSILTMLSSDTPRGNGSFYDGVGSPVPDYWLAVVWSIASLDWSCGKEIARDWSQKSSRFTTDGFEEAWKGYKPSHPKAIGIGSLYKRALELGWQNTLAPTIAPPNPSRYQLLNRADIEAILPLVWCVKGVFPATGIAGIYGPSASGKSFLAFDMAAAIAEGAEWFGFKTNATPVVYAALEGEAGFRLRVKAWEAKNGRPLPPLLHMIMQPFRITEPQDVADLAAVIPRRAVVIVDTLNRAAPTVDENSSKDMGNILEAAKRLQMLTKGLVVLVHHTGKDTSKGLRGHSSLFAALDGAIEVERTGNGRKWVVAKVKDGSDGKQIPFQLKVHDMGKDADGDPLTSCTVERDYGQVFQTPEPSGKDQKAALKLMKAEIPQSKDTNKAGSGTQTQCLKVEDAITRIAGTLTTVQANKRNNRARTILKALTDGGYVQSGLDGDEGWVWLP